MGKELVIERELMERLEQQLTRIRASVPNTDIWDRTALGQLLSLLGQSLNDKIRKKQLKIAESRAAQMRFLRRKEDRS